MKYYLSFKDYNENWNKYQPLSRKADIEAFVDLLRKAGFPESNIKINGLGFELDLEGTVLRKVDSGFSTTISSLCYGDLALVDTNVKESPWESYQHTQLHSKNVKKLPQKMIIDEEDKEEENQVIAKAQKEWRVNKPGLQENKYQNNAFLKECLLRIWKEKGLEGDHLKFKLSRTLPVLKTKVGHEANVILCRRKIDRENERINKVLGELKDKIGKEKQHEFQPAINVAKELLKELDEHKINYVSALRAGEEDAFGTFESKCSSSINKANPTLAKDWGWGKFIANFTLFQP